MAASRPRIDPATAHRIVRARHEGERLERQAVAQAFGITPEHVEGILWEWEPRVYPHIGIAPRPAEIVAAREGRLPPSRLIDGEHPQLRWERIAFRSGTTVRQVREMYEQVRGPGSSRRHWTGKGRRFAEME